MSQNKKPRDKKPRLWHSGERSWHAGKPVKKPNYNPDAVTEELVQAVVDCYVQTDEDDDSNGAIFFV